MEKNAADPYGTTGLKKVVSEILWTRAYIVNCCRQCPLLVDSKSETASVMQSMLDQPLIFSADGRSRARSDLDSIASE